MNLLINMMTRFGLLKDDLDYHLIRASMVIIFLFFGYQKWFEYEAQALIPYISNGPPHFLDVSCIWHSGGHLLPGGIRMVVWCALVLRILEQKTRNSGGPRFMFFLYRYCHDYPIYAGWLGCVCRRVPRYD